MTNPRPMMERAASEAAEGVEGIDPLTILTALEFLLPLLRVCAGADVAGWLRGDGALLSRAWAARRREAMVRRRLAGRDIRGLPADRLVERLRRATPLEMAVAYREAGV